MFMVLYLMFSSVLSSKILQADSMITEPWGSDPGWSVSITNSIEVEFSPDHSENGQSPSIKVVSDRHAKFEVWEGINDGEFCALNREFSEKFRQAVKNSRSCVIFDLDWAGNKSWRQDCFGSSSIPEKKMTVYFVMEHFNHTSKQEINIFELIQNINVAEIGNILMKRTNRHPDTWGNWGACTGSCQKAVKDR